MADEQDPNPQAVEAKDYVGRLKKKTREFEHYVKTSTEPHCKAAQALSRLTNNKLPPHIIAFIVLLIIICAILFTTGLALITDVVSVVYPMVKTFQVVKSSQDRDANDAETKRWLKYWLSFAFINIVEFPINVILHVMPWWYVAKLILVVYLLYPKKQEPDGNDFLYLQISKALAKLEPTIVKLEKVFSSNSDPEGQLSGIQGEEEDPKDR